MNRFKHMQEDDKNMPMIGAGNGYYTKLPNPPGRERYISDDNNRRNRNEDIFDEPRERNRNYNWKYDRSRERSHDRYSDRHSRPYESHSPRRRHGSRGHYEDYNHDYKRSYSRTPSPRRKYRRSRSRSLSQHRDRRNSRSSWRRYSKSPFNERRASRSKRSVSSTRNSRKRSSSKDARSGRSSSEESVNFNVQNKPGDDFFKSMYSKAKEESQDDSIPPGTSPSIIDHEVHQKLKNPVVEDEDIFLYGNSAEISKLPTTVIPEKSHPKEKIKEDKVTPGGFDSNALQNVLKAIGFNFEMSAQSQQKFLGTTEVAINNQPILPNIVSNSGNNPIPISLPLQIPVSNEAPVAPLVTNYPHSTSESKQPMYTFPSANINPDSYSPFPVNQPKQTHLDTNQQVLSSTKPLIPNQKRGHSPEHGTLPRHTSNNKSANINYQSSYSPFISNSLSQQPLKEQIPQNQGNFPTYPVQTQEEHMYQEAREFNSSIQEREKTDFLSNGQKNKGFIKPDGNTKSLFKKDKSREARKLRLDYLEDTLEKLKAQQNELIRKKRREKDGHKHPLIQKNNLLQVQVEDEIQEIRKLAEEAAGLDEEDKIRYEYFDPGNHWCSLCNLVCSNIYEYLAHLQSKSHKKLIDPYNRPWMSHGKEDEKEVTSAQKTVAAPLKGTEFLLPVAGYYCSLCDMFSGDQTCAEDHCKTMIHNKNFKMHCKKNEKYEDKRKLDMAAAMSMSGNKKAKKSSDDDKPSKETKKKKSIDKPKELPKQYRDPTPEKSPHDNREKNYRHSKRSNRWSPGYDEFDKRMSAEQPKRNNMSQYEMPRENVDNIAVMDMELDDDQPTFRNSIINLNEKNIEMDRQHVRYESSNSDRNQSSSFTKEKIAIPFSVNKQEPNTKLRRDSSGSKSDGSERKPISLTINKKPDEKSQPKKTPEEVRKLNALRAKLSAITVPSARSKSGSSIKNKKPTFTSKVESMKVEAIVKQRTELAKVAQKAWGHMPMPHMMANYSMSQMDSFGNILPYNYTALPQTVNPPTVQITPTDKVPVSSNNNKKTEVVKPKVEKAVSPEPNSPSEYNTAVMDKEEPRPPGEDDSDGDGNESDASGISMELASDEE